jgi:hypothetical protein
MKQFSTDINNFESLTKFHIDSHLNHKYHKHPTPPRMGARDHYWRNNTLKDRK